MTDRGSDGSVGITDVISMSIATSAVAGQLDRLVRVWRESSSLLCQKESRSQTLFWSG
jgi:hypothetical protein